MTNAQNIDFSVKMTERPKTLNQKKFAQNEIILCIEIVHKEHSALDKTCLFKRRSREAFVISYIIGPENEVSMKTLATNSSMLSQ